MVLANGTTKTVPIVDHNVWEATVTGRITAIIAKNIRGRTVRQPF